MPDNPCGPPRFEPSDKDIMVARKLVRLGGVLADVHAALGWKCSQKATSDRLRRIGIIVPRKHVKRAHRGDETYLHPKDQPKESE